MEQGKIFFRKNDERRKAAHFLVTVRRRCRDYGYPSYGHTFRSLMLVVLWRLTVESVSNPEYFTFYQKLYEELDRVNNYKKYMARLH